MNMLKRAIIGVALNGGTLFAVTYLLEEVTYTGGYMFFVIGGVTIGLLNSLVKPLLKILALPFVVLTAGLFIIVINAFILWFTKYFLDVIQFRDVAISVTGVGGYIVGAFLFGLINWGAHIVIKNK